MTLLSIQIPGRRSGDDLGPAGRDDRPDRVRLGRTCRRCHRCGGHSRNFREKRFVCELHAFEF